MRARDDDGVELNAEFAVEADRRGLNLVLESAGGRSGDRTRPRNHQYVPALRLLLQRLADRRAVLLSALVASARLAALPETDRILVQGPVELAKVPDMERFRLDITSAQGRVGLSPGAPKEGNNRKRLRLRLDVPDYGPADASRLAADLAAPSGPEPLVPPGAEDLLRSLVGQEILTAAGRPNMILALRGSTALVRTSRSPAGQPVPVTDVQDGLDKLAARGSVPVTVAELGHRSAFVGAVLATLPGAYFTQHPAAVTLGTPVPPRAAGADPVFGVLDSVASVRIRREQAYLRNLLAGQREQARCAICGQLYPMGFLVAAHIKKRSLCTDDERRDLRHVAMLACSFGCDALYEAGWITVDGTGQVQTIPPDTAPSERIREHLQQLAGRYCTAHDQATETYFAWHRTTIFRRPATSIPPSQ
jgi:hypothetical protein